MTYVTVMIQNDILLHGAFLAAGFSRMTKRALAISYRQHFQHINVIQGYKYDAQCLCY